MADPIYLNDTLRVTFTFTDTAGAVTDPTTVTLSFRPPQGGWRDYVYGTDAAVVKSATGIYYVDVSCNRLGKWTYKAVGDNIASPRNWTFDVVKEPD